MEMSQRRVLLLIVLFVWPSAGMAHRLDEYLQATLVDIQPNDVRLRINLTPGVEVADQVLGLIDRDRDGVISAGEAEAYGETVRRDLVARLDGRDVELKLTASDSPTPAELRGGEGIIQLQFALVVDDANEGSHTLHYENRHLPGISIYLLNAARPRYESIQIRKQNRNQTQSIGEIAFSFQRTPRPARLTAAVAAVAAGAAAVAAAVARRRSRSAT
jgi:hypothetical protein